MLKRLTHDRLDAAPAVGRGRRRGSRATSGARSGRCSRGRIAPVIDRTFPLAEAAAAHALMESSEHIGKIVLTVGG